MIKKSSLFAIILMLGAVFASAQTQSATDVVMVLPFENTSGKGEFNWVGESFADSLSDLLRVPTITVISNEQRKVLQQQLRIPLTSLPSLATSLKLAQKTNTSLLVSGRYEIVPAAGEAAATIKVSVRMVRVNEGRYVGEDFPDGGRQTNEIVISDALSKLQKIQGQVAFQILYKRNRAVEYSQDYMIGLASKVPAKAFEAYIKGLITQSVESRENYFKNASRLYSEALEGIPYTEAELELGHLYLSTKRGNEAVASFERVISQYTKCRDRAKTDKKPARCQDQSFAEASFYIGLLYLQQGNFESAMATLKPLADDLHLTNAYNALGAITVQGSRAEKKNPARAAAMLNDGLELLKKAAESSPDDASILFNYATALFLNGNLTESAAQMRNAIVKNPRDGEAYFILAKALETLKDAKAVEMANEAQRLLTDNNKYAKLETEWQKSRTLPDVSLRVIQPARKDFVSVVLSRRPITNAAPVSETDTLLAQARTQIKNGQDDDAMATLRRVLASEPMSAESYSLLGKIHLRRGDIDQAISSFKTSIFWDNRLIDAHVSLGKIYVEKGDCLQAKTYAVSAAEIDAENQDVLALQRLSERCSK